MAKKTTKPATKPKPSTLGKYPITYRRVPIDDIFEDPANARKHGPENLAAIAGSLRSFGQVESLVVQKSSGKVIGGNGRLASMRSLKWTEVDIAEIDIDNAGAAALGIVLNRSAELAEWNDENLEAILREIETGDEDLQAMLAKLAEEQDISPKDEPNAPEDFGTVDENIDVEHTCPKCGYQFSGGS